MKKIKLGLLGKNISYSLSPAIYNHWFGVYGINANYDIVDISLEQISLEFMLSLHTKGYEALNVTVPYKESFLRYFKTSKEVMSTRSSNLLKFYSSNSDLINNPNPTLGCCYNTDCAGFLISLKKFKQKVDLSNKNILVIGSGGSAKSVVYALLKSKVLSKEISKITTISNQMGIILGKINIYCRNKEKLKYLKGLFPSNKVNIVTDISEISNIGLVVNTTPYDNLHPFNFKYKKLLNKECLFYDLRYNLEQNFFLKEASTLDFKFTDGLGMLIEQARLNFKILFSIYPNLTYSYNKFLQIIT